MAHRSGPVPHAANPQAKTVRSGSEARAGTPVNLTDEIPDELFPLTALCDHCGQPIHRPRPAGGWIHGSVFEKPPP